VDVSICGMKQLAPHLKSMAIGLDSENAIKMHWLHPKGDSPSSKW